MAISDRDDVLFALPVKVVRCARNPKRLVIVSATGEVLLRTLSVSFRDQDTAERFALAMNEWAAEEERRMTPLRYGLGKIDSVAMIEGVH